MVSVLELARRDDLPTLAETKIKAPAPLGAGRDSPG